MANPAVNRTRRYGPSTWHASARRAGYLGRLERPLFGIGIVIRGRRHIWEQTRTV